MVLLLVALHKRERAESRAFFRALAGSVRDLRTRKGTPRRQRQFRRQQADQESLLNHDARYNDFAGRNGSGLSRDATMPRDSLAGLIDTITAIRANILLALLPPASDR